MKKYTKYRIRDITDPGFYFSIWVFGWGSIQEIIQKVDSIQEWGCNITDTVYLLACVV